MTHESRQSRSPRLPIYKGHGVAIYTAKRRPWWWLQVTRLGSDDRLAWSAVAPFWRFPRIAFKHRGRAAQVTAYRTGRRQGRIEGKAIERARHDA